MTSELEMLRQVKEVEEKMKGKSADYRLGFIHGAKFIVDYFAHKYNRLAETPPEPNLGASKEF